VGVKICRQTDFAPVGSVGCACSLGLAGEANGVAADQKMCRETIAGSQMKAPSTTSLPLTANNRIHSIVLSVGASPPRMS
jgi:hypothetical protein